MIISLPIHLNFYHFQIHQLKELHADPHPGNFIITNDEQVAKQFANDSWSVRQKLEAAKAQTKSSEPEPPVIDSADVDEAESDDKLNDEL
jgi:hypothetical protein